jgi:hypothetical protein
LRRILSIAILLIGLGLMAEAQKPSAAPERTRVLLILDCSQSMWDKWQSDAKIKVTQKVLLRLLDSIATRFNELNSAQNRFMLSETQSLLS